MVRSENIYIQVPLQRLSRFSLGIFIATCKHVTTINGKRNHEFEREQGKHTHGWAGREDREGGNNVIIL